MPRAICSILVALVAILILPTSVMAAKADRYTDTSTQLWCGELQSEAGTAYVNAWLSDRGETFADLGFWAAAEPGEDPVTWSGWANDGLMSINGSALESTFGVYAVDQDSEDPSEPVFVGDATLSATLTPSGDLETFRYNDRYGNHRSRSSGSWQRLDVTGSLLLPDDISFDLADCEGFRSTEQGFSNNPTHPVSHFSELGLSCGWQTDDGYVALFAARADFGTGAELWISNGDTFIYGAGSATLSSSAFDATFDLYPDSEEPDAVGTASASAALTTLDRISDTQRFGDSRYTFKGVRLGVLGSLTIETDGDTSSLDMDDSTCQASDMRTSQLPARRVRAEAVPNDTPETAIPLKAGDKLLVSTAGTVVAPEASCLLDDGGGGTFEGALTHTVWWRIEGTGGSITIDTANSTFDTLVGVYLVEDGAVGAQVGCVDDVDEGVLARITFDTAADASYLVQTGGFHGQTGDLGLLISEP